MVDPIDADAIDDRLVLADLLMQRGDPLGELISVQHALEVLPPEAPRPKRRRLEAQIAQLLSAHHAALFGALAPHIQAPHGPAPRAPALEISWRGGFAESALIESPGPTLELADIYRALRRLPLARFLRRLEVGRGDYAGFMAALGADPAPSLAELILHGQREILEPSKLALQGRVRRGSFQYEPTHIQAVIDGGVLAKLPALEVLRMVDMADGLLAIDAPALRHLSVQLTKRGVDELARSALPSLETLSCFRAEPSIELLERSPHLTRFSAGDCRGLPAILRWLIGSPLLPRLTELKLWASDLDDTDLAFIIAHADRLAHLELLDLTGQPFRRATAEAALHRLPRLLVSDGDLR